jgi:hypothetical protein
MSFGPGRVVVHCLASLSKCKAGACRDSMGKEEEVEAGACTEHKLQILVLFYRCLWSW